ncbi:DNA topoisomerase 1 [Candidatus Ecksteinia adelgidicola]|nr:DNA topoisomerase 1 [Candidatus Ecksteinia adelgidicola]
MEKVLVIVESPAKAKTINQYLGENFIVKSSIGHIRDLSPKRSTNKKKTNLVQSKKNISKDNQHQKMLVKRIGIDPYHGWKANYEILPGKEKIVSELKSLAKQVEHIYLATDLDREGEAIAWHLKEVIGEKDEKFSRVVFNEITKKSIQKAFKNPGKLNISRIHAQQARRFMDRIVGYMISPLLWKKIARGLSAGRVQSVALRLLVDRERDIKKFIPKEYFSIHADLFIEHNIILRMKVSHIYNKSLKLINHQDTQSAIKLLEKARYTVLSRQDKLVSRKANSPFITSTLQQAASTHLHFNVKKTMALSQALYEAGYITYMRTDSTSLNKDALNVVRDYIKNQFGSNYLPQLPNQYSNKKNLLEAHEAIRPSNVTILSNQLKDMKLDAKKLYSLIWRQFVACQMLPAQYDVSILLVQADNYYLRSKSYQLRFDGWTKIIPSQLQGYKTCILPCIKVNSELNLKKLLSTQHFTKPPSRYSDASLVKELEKRGIGRPSTYASIISTIQDRGYVRVENQRFYAEKIGEIVTDRLIENFNDLMSYNFTACMEDRLDQISKNDTEWKTMLNEFFIHFNKQLKIAEKNSEEGGMRQNTVVITSINCLNCGRKMGIRTASTGVFLGCSGYTLSSKERCKITINLIPEIELLNILEGDEAETNALLARKRCQKCGTAMDSYFINNLSKLHICGNNPTCNGYTIEEGKFCLKRHHKLIVQCDKCSSTMNLKIGRFGKYMSCTNENCKKTRKILSNGKIEPSREDAVPLPELLCHKSDAYFVLRDGKSGLFLSANTFPKSRETRAPLVKELIYFKNRLPKKFHYLTDAPLIDNVGNETLVRFSHKKNQQYITSEKDGKSTGWFSFYVKGKWIEDKK